ncbi:puf protein [Pavlovales sp. CCMP2436]|nr:puf protein [Pavlovales sp. CCMP2436]
MVDPFANYLVQKMVHYASAEHQLLMVQAIAPSLPEIALNVHGTRAVQRLLECVRGEKAESLVAAALAPRVHELMRDLHANHVVQRCVATLTSGRNAFVFEAVSRALVEVGTHRHGCCVLQRCLDNAAGATRTNLVDSVIEHTRALIADQFGNYIVQYILQLHEAKLTRRVVHAITGSVAELACEKFSSNVIEKCLTSGDQIACSLVIAELLEPAALGRLLHDPYGNYVVQRMLQVATEAEQRLMLERVAAHGPSLRNTLYGKRFQAKLLKQFPGHRTGD